MRFSDFQKKEVINVSTGERLGYTDDLIFSERDGQIESIVVPGPGKLFGLIRGEEMVVPWGSICRIGDDVILVEVHQKRTPRRC
ncbi:YlmC/YmxH family sporulation protein [Gehongia tenuis]|uniref:YlmC/YmxH family sporulation protein n=1 Tax=Gehongia tenuis TaxID=2763655 RepID=A0A926HQ47_9FIRM|nr:YlmC/YmxH family sporulation protein [Gehongia tenuis]MBC8530871.1 YlmC/YmxH family sporulation protein [Gehongia tenuis]